MAGIFCLTCNTTIQPDNPLDPSIPIIPDKPLEPSEPTITYKCDDCGLSFVTQSEYDSHICLKESSDYKLRKEREEWWMTFLKSTNPNDAGNVVSNRCPTWGRIFNWVKNYYGGVKVSSNLMFTPSNMLIENIFYNLGTALIRIPYKDLSVTLSRTSYSQSFSGSSVIGNIIEVFRFTTDSSSAREYIFGDFTIILSGTGFNTNGGGSYSWGVNFYLCNSSGTILTNFATITKIVSNDGSSYNYSNSILVSGNWNTINYDLSANTTYIVKAQLFTGTPFDGTATLQWMISNNSPKLRCFIMDKCPKQFDAFGIRRIYGGNGVM